MTKHLPQAVRGEINAAVMDCLVAHKDPTLSLIERALKMIRDRDLIHVDAIAAWVMSQDAEYRNDLLAELQAAAAEEQHEQRMRDGFPSSAEFAAHCLRTAGRGHLLAD